VAVAIKAAISTTVAMIPDECCHAPQHRLHSSSTVRTYQFGKIAEQGTLRRIPTEDEPRDRDDYHEHRCEEEHRVEGNCRAHGRARSSSQA
jgi:hypothetical protein